MNTTRLNAVDRNGVGHRWPGLWVHPRDGSEPNALWLRCHRFAEVGFSKPPPERSTRDNLGRARNAGPSGAMIAEVVPSSRCVSVTAS